MSYNRYKKFLENGRIENIPYVKIMPKDTDYFEAYKRGNTRLDKVSNKYYGDSNYDWLIMMANPELGSMEFEIPDGSMMRIPYPLEVSISDYEKQINLYRTLYGI